ncbi:MAG TPA: Nramp family divalent metal transporter [Candidatus Sulfotelmatobacter sp.]|nr:Nramp family divalent metal transporter [Candidatus Sulfotelmatobacter sp.]
MGVIAEYVNGSSGRTLAAARDVLAGGRRGVAAALPFVGPAFIASVAYVDPGNFATNIAAGSAFGYRLLWVVIVANVLAMVFQALSAKLGVVTARNLAELCRERLPGPVTCGMWLTSEVAAMATDLAEFLGAALAFHLLFGIPMGAAAGLTALVTLALLQLQSGGFRPLEAAIAALVAVIGLAYVLETLVARPSWPAIAAGSVVPWLHGSDSVLVAVGIVGATVMPHAIYLHSALTQDRVRPAHEREARRIVRFSNREVVAALTLAGAINLAMVVMAAAVFHAHGRADVATIPSAYRTLVPLLGSAAAAVFLTALLASGISSSAVGTLAGQVVMQGFVGFTVPLWVRRVVTMAPALAVVAAGIDPTQVLVLSQVVLSLTVPIPIAALIAFTASPAVMGSLANSRTTTLAATLGGLLILGLNLVLLVTLLPH